MNHCQICHTDFGAGVSHTCGGTPTACPAGGHIKPTDYQPKTQLDRIEEMLNKLLSPKGKEQKECDRTCRCGCHMLGAWGVYRNPKHKCPKGKEGR